MVHQDTQSDHHKLKLRAPANIKLPQIGAYAGVHYAGVATQRMQTLSFAVFRRVALSGANTCSQLTPPAMLMKRPGPGTYIGLGVFEDVAGSRNLRQWHQHKRRTARTCFGIGCCNVSAAQFVRGTCMTVWIKSGRMASQPYAGYSKERSPETKCEMMLLTQVHGFCVNLQLPDLKLLRSTKISK